jgi:osmotically-inducible protein OsmY
MSATRYRLGPLLAGTLGVAALGCLSSVMAQDAPKDDRDAQIRNEVVVTAGRQSDTLITARVTTALQQDPFIFSDHVTVTTENGVVRLEGIVRDLPDLISILRLARRIAGKGRVVNRIEYDTEESDHD